jgi:hypothetical protein
MVILTHTIVNVANVSQFLTVRERNISANLGSEFPQGFDHQISWL